MTIPSPDFTPRLALSYQPRLTPTGLPRLPRTCWLLPFQQSAAYLFRPKLPDTANNLLGPYLFDTVEALQLFLQHFPRHFPPSLSWQFVADLELLDWIPLVPVFHFIFWLPDEPFRLLAATMQTQPLLQDVLLRHIPLYHLSGIDYLV